MHPRGPLIFILHQYLVIGRWWILTSVIQRHKNLKYVVCKSALNYSGDNSGHVSSWAHTQVRQYRRTEIIFFKGGNILPNGPEKSHPNLHPQPAVGLTAHLTLSIIIFKIFYQLAQQTQKASTCSHFYFFNYLQDWKVSCLPIIYSFCLGSHVVFSTNFHLAEVRKIQMVGNQIALKPCL